MPFSNIVKDHFRIGAYDKTLTYLYGQDAVKMQKDRYLKAIDQFETLFGDGREIRIFSAPGRTEVGGNHTDHQKGRVLAAGVNLDIIAILAINDSTEIKIKSQGYNMIELDCHDTSIKESEYNTTTSLIRGTLSAFEKLGCKAEGFDAYMTSDVLRGSGLSSSAAFETLFGTIINTLFWEGKETPVKIAQIGQYVENEYFGKPCGLMDQTASSVGSFITIDFQDTENPIVEKIDFDFEKSGYALCIVDTGGSHADLTPDYASIPEEMGEIAAYFGKQTLREVPEEEVYHHMDKLRKKFGDRPVLRALHFYDDNNRVPLQAAALKENNFEEFKKLIIESGESSFMCLQNVFSCGNPKEQGITLALAICKKILRGKGAWRVHGGGFAGTIQAFVPKENLQAFREEMEKIFGAGKCYVLSIRPIGGTEILPANL